MDDNLVAVEDLEFHDSNGGHHALWNISPPNSRWVSCSLDEVHSGGDIDVDEWTDGALIVGTLLFLAINCVAYPENTRRRCCAICSSPMELVKF